ncbi:MAG: SDR family NAD(P)-dependent oxidoreductase, partial [Acidimicrobiales bacterium]
MHGKAERFSDKVVVVTGSATGIGEATMVRFASEAAKVVGLDVNFDENAATVAEIRHAGGEAVAIECDVRVEDA